MPRQRPRITAAEQREYLDRLRLLKQSGIATGPVPPRPARFILQQVYPQFAWVYELATRQVAVVTLAKLRVQQSGVRIVAGAMTIPGYDGELELSNQGEYPDLEALVPDVWSWSPRILNDLWAKPDAPLRIGEYEGLIFAIDHGVLPASYHDQDSIVTELWLRDEQGDETECDFHCGIDRGTIRELDRKIRAAKTMRDEGGGLNGTRVGKDDRASVSPSSQGAMERDQAGNSRTSKVGEPVPRTRLTHWETIH